MNERLDYLHKKALELTKSPGVYIMKNKQGKIIYIGKAKNLTNRVRSYFAKTPNHTAKVSRMVSNVYDFDYIVTDSEYEALVLECSLIKMHAPKYNILLKDDKGYHYIRISDDRYPRITAEKNNLAGGSYIGPYTSSFTVSQTVDEANRVFKLPTCKKKFPEEFRKARPCLNSHIGLCSAVCRGKIREKEYNDIIAQAVDYIKNGSEQSVRSLTEKMNEASEALDFERAALLRDRIRAIEKAGEKQKIISADSADKDMIAGAQSGENCVFAVLKYRAGRLCDKEHYFISGTDNLSEVRDEFIVRYYSSNVDIPKAVYLDDAVGDMELLQQFLRGLANHAVTVNVPVRGEQKKLVMMAVNNAAEQLSCRAQTSARDIAALDALAKLLGLESAPEYIESYDISNLGDSGIVAGMVVFYKGRPLKSAYKKFALKDMPVRDDYASMIQVISRRFDRYEQEKDSGEGFGKKPDLILLDGGKGHVSAVRPVLAERGLDIPVFGMVKDDRHRTRAIAESGGEIAISETKPAFNLVTAIQDEVHRFSITYQKSTRKKSMFSSKLTSVKGIGEKKAAALMKKYKTKAGLKAAPPDELAKTAGVTGKTAEELCRVISEM